MAQEFSPPRSQRRPSHGLRGCCSMIPKGHRPWLKSFLLYGLQSLSSHGSNFLLYGPQRLPPHSLRAFSSMVFKRLSPYGFKTRCSMVPKGDHPMAQKLSPLRFQKGTVPWRLQSLPFYSLQRRFPYYSKATCAITSKYA